MKNLSKIAIIAILIFFSAVSSTFATPKVDLFVNNSQVHPDSPAYISSTNRTMVPISFVSQAFGFNTTWDGKTQEVKVEADGTVVVLTIGSKYAVVNGQRVEVDPGKGTAPVIRNSRTMVPVSFIASSFGVEVKWTAYPGSGGRVNFISKDFTPPVVPPTNLPTLPNGQKFEEGKVLTPDQLQGSIQPIPGNDPSRFNVTVTNADSVRVRNNLTLYPKDIFVAKAGTSGKDFIFMRASGGGAATMYAYKGDELRSITPVGDNYSGWMMMGEKEDFGKLDYLLFYGTEHKLVPMPTRDMWDGVVYPSIDAAKKAWTN